MTARDGFRYWYDRDNAVNYANLAARLTGKRYRVQLATWTPSRRWYVAPTPADAPTPKVMEPCS
jgi:hypothetical protein